MYKNVCLDSFLVRQLKHRGFICNALNCLNEENKRFSNCLFLSLYLIFFSSSFALYLIFLMKKTKCLQIISIFIFLFIFSCSYHIYKKAKFRRRNCLELRHVSIFFNSNVCLDSLLVRQLKHRGFICNALNCLNDKTKGFQIVYFSHFIQFSFHFLLLYI